MPVDRCLPSACSSNEAPPNLRELNLTSYNYSTSFVADCLPGHRAVSLDNRSAEEVLQETASCVTDSLTAMPVSCGSRDLPCSWQFGHVCIPVACNFSSAVPPFSSVSTDSTVIRFGETVTISCDPGYRLSNVSEGTTRRSDPQEVSLACGADCEVHAAPLFCLPTACGDFSAGSTQRLLGDATGMLHGDSVLASCVDGLIPRGSLTSSCESTFEVACVDGLFVGNTTCLPPSCGNGCELPCLFPVDENSEMNVSGAAVEIPHGASLSVACKFGFRAAAETIEGRQAQCEDPGGYTVSCDRMCVSEHRSCEVLCVEEDGFEEHECADNAFQQNCRAVKCFADHLVPENGFALTSGFTVYGEFASVDCDRGFRMWFEGEASAPPTLPPSAPQGMTAYCNATCELEGRREACVITTCGEFQPAPGQVVVTPLPVEGVEFVHGDALLVRCEEGLAPDGVIPPNCNDPFPVRCDDGAFAGNFECLAPVSHGCPPFEDAFGEVAVAETDFAVRVQVECREGFVAWDTSVDAPGASCGDSSYEDECELCSFEGALRCVRAGCGLFAPRGVLGRPEVLETVVQDPEFVLYEQNATIVCPPGTRVGSPDVEAPPRVASVCRSDCAFDVVPQCEPISCGTYEVPVLSIGRVRSYDGTVSDDILQPGATVELFFGESVVLTCDEQHILTNGDAECAYEGAVTCEADGLLSNGEVGCKRQACAVACAEGTAWPGFGGSAFGCSFNYCPASAPREYSLAEGCPRGAPSRCSITEQCTPIACQTFVPPEQSSAVQQADGGSEQPVTGPVQFAVVGHNITVTCHQGLIPEFSVPDAADGSGAAISPSYLSRCQPDSTWSNHPQRCLAASCVAVDGEFSCGAVYPRAVEGVPWAEETVSPEGYIALSESSTITCPEGTRLNSTDASAPISATQQCHPDCFFDPVPACVPVSCGIFQVPANSSAVYHPRPGDPLQGMAELLAGDTVALSFNESVTVTCDRGAVLTFEDNADCEFQQAVTCLADGSLSAAGFGCRRQPCEVQCEVGTRYAGANASAFGCGGGRCPALAPRAYTAGEGCSAGALSRCAEARNCTPVECSSAAAPAHAVVVEAADLPRWNCSDAHNATLRTAAFGQRARVGCLRGFAPESEIRAYREVGNASAGRLGSLGLEVGAQCREPLESVCQDDGSWSNRQQCLRTSCLSVGGNFSCGVFRPRPVMGMPWISDAVDVSGFIMLSDSFTVSCPPGTRLGSSSPAAASEATGRCNEDCGLDEIPRCVPVSCGTFQVPRNSSAVKRGADGVVLNATARAGEDVEMRFNDSVALTCAEGHILSSGAADCSFEAAISCLASGELSPRNLSCPRQDCTVRCDEGRAWGGASGSEHGCSASLCESHSGRPREDGSPVRCCPPSAPREFSLPSCPAGALSRCEAASECTAPVACAPFRAPPFSHAQHQEIGGFLLRLHGELTGAVYGHSATVYCDAGRIPESLVPRANATRSPVDPVANSYATECGADGEWSRHPQQCVSASCVVAPGGRFSCGRLEPRAVEGRSWVREAVSETGFMLVNGTATVTCPEGTRLGSSNVSAEDSGEVLCSIECSFTALPTCEPISCGAFEVPPNSSVVKRGADGSVLEVRAGPASVALLFNESAQVTCARDFALPGSSFADCRFRAAARCLASGELSLAAAACELNACRDNLCSYPVANQSLLPPPQLDALVGESLQLRCAAGLVAAASAAQGQCGKNFSALCLPNAEFDPVHIFLPQCQPAACPPLTSVDPFALSTPATSAPASFGDRVQVRCQPNFAAGGVPFAQYEATCGAADADGLACTWALPERRCEPVLCSSLVPPSRGSLLVGNRSAVAAGERVTIQCDAGFRLEGAGFGYGQCAQGSSRLCLESGQLEPLDAECVPVLCPPLSAITPCSLESRARKPEALADRQTSFGEELEVHCPRQPELPPERLRCRQDCALAPYTLLCDPVTCSPLSAYNLSAGTAAAAVAGRRGRGGALGGMGMVIGSRLSLECPEGLEPVTDADLLVPPEEELQTLSVVLWRPSVRYDNVDGCR